MNARLLSIFIFTSLLLVTACTPGTIEKLGAPTGSQGNAVQSGQVELLNQDEPASNTAPSSGDVIVQTTPLAEGMTDIITSSGQKVQIKPSTDGNELKVSGSGAAGGSAPSGEAQQPVNWLTYQDNAFGFSISYPDSYVILKEIETLKDIDAKLVHRVRFQDKNLASSETAQYEVPNFSVEVYEKPDIETLQAFIAAIGPKWTIEAFQIGNLQGYRVQTNLMMAPNEFYFFEGSNYIYKLTPLGPYSQEMLQSFRIGG